MQVDVSSEAEVAIIRGLQIMGGLAKVSAQAQAQVEVAVSIRLKFVY